MRLLLFLLFSTSASALAAAPPIRFEQNFGQTDSRVRYLARSPHGVVFFTDRQIVFTGKESSPVTFELMGADDAAQWQASVATGEQTSYRVGRDPQRWADHVNQYARLMRYNVYPGIDAVWHGEGRQIEYDFVLTPGADPGRIRIRIQGGRRVFIDGNGELVISAEGREIRQHKPVIYQTAADGSRLPVEGGFRIHGRNETGFHIGPYDRSKPLTIDPVIDFSSYLGGEGEDQIVYAAEGIAVGNTTSIDFPDAEPARRQGSKIFLRTGSVTRILGGSGDDRVTGVLSGSLNTGMPILYGYTNSTDLPTSPFSVQPDYAGGVSDGFFLYFNLTSGFSMVVSYYGTSGEDRITGGVAANYSNPIAFTGWTTGRGLPIGGGFSLSRQAPLVEDGPGGGVDGFLASGSLLVNFNGTETIVLNNVRYFGGSRDDRPASVTYSPHGYYLAGATSSSDFPNVTASSIQGGGDSDAFVVLYANPFTNPASLLFGGSGPDRAHSVTIVQNGLAIGVAGTTASADLPLMVPLQPAFGGGASDAFLGTFAPDLSRMFSATYWGGSGAEEVTAVSTDVVNNWFIAGRTTSPDFPVINAVQATYGGGPDDGFLLHGDSDGKVHQSTFFGGSGSDRILGVTAGDSSTAWIAGETTSRDLPLRNAERETLRGPSDGFVAAISTRLIGGTHVSGSKGFRAGAYLGLPNAGPAITFTLSTSDPAAVLLADTQGGAASRSISLVGGGWVEYFVDCQVDGATAGIRVTAPGYPDAIARVDCVRPSIVAGFSSVIVVNGTFRMSLWSEPSRVFVSLFAINPNNRNDINRLFAKSDGERIPIQVQVSDPAVLKASVSSLLLRGNSDFYSENTELLVTPLSLGTTEIVLSSSSLPAESSTRARFDVVRPITVFTPQPIPGGFQMNYSLGLSGRAPEGTSVSFTSGDPNSLLISMDARETGTGSVTMPLSIGPGPGFVYLQALTSRGETSLTVSVTGFESVTIPVRFKDPALTVLSPLLSSPTLGVGEITSLNPSFESFIPNPQSNGLRLSLESSDDAVLKVAPSYIDISARSPYADFQIFGVASGVASLTLRSSNGVAPPAGANPLRVTVATRSLQLRDVEVGKDLMVHMSLTLPPRIPLTTLITISSSDPDRALVSSSYDQPGQAQISVRAGEAYSIYVAALADSGEVRITASASGAGSATATAKLVPSGFGWSNDFLSSDLYYAAAPSVDAYALDPGTLLPISLQILRVGVAATVEIRNDRPNIATLPNPSVVFPRSTQITVRNLATGDTTLTLTQPAGFTTPNSRQRLTWRVTKAPLWLHGGPLGIHTQQQMEFSNLPAAAKGKTATITSSDPARLVVSADANVLGSGTLTFEAGKPFFIQALANRGVVHLVAALDGFTDTRVPIQLMGTTVLLEVQQGFFGGSLLKSDGAYTTLFSGTTQITAHLALVDPDSGSDSFMPGNLMLRAGMDRSIAVQSTNPSVGTILNSPVRFDQSVSSTTPVEFQPVAAGETEVGAVLPPGFTVPSDRPPFRNGRIPFHVTLPGWDIGEQAPLGKDTARGAFLRLAANLSRFSTDVPVSIRSSDPSRLLLSRDDQTVGSNAISMTLSAGAQSAGRFFMQALGREGSVRLVVTAPGFAETNFEIRLTDTFFGIQANSLPSIVVLQGGPVGGRVGFGTGDASNDAMIRPGIAIAVRIDSSDPSVLAIDTPDVILRSGSFSVEFTARPVGLGKATVKLAVPGFQVVPPGAYTSHSSAVDVAVELVQLYIRGEYQTGKDQQTGASIGTETVRLPNLVYTITSSDPSLLLVSTGAGAVGSAETTLAAPNDRVYLQGLANSGTATVTVSAPGTQPATLSMQLTPSGVAFGPSSSLLNLDVNGSPIRLPVQLYRLDPSSLWPLCCNEPRPGWSATVTVTSSDPEVVSVTPGAVELPGSGPQYVELKPLAAGTATVTVSVPPGSDRPANGREIIVNVR